MTGYTGDCLFYIYMNNKYSCGVRIGRRRIYLGHFMSEEYVRIGETAILQIILVVDQSDERGKELKLIRPNIGKELKLIRSNIEGDQ